MTLVFRVTGGVHVKLDEPFCVSENVSANYPIQVTPDNVPGYSYRTQRKAWMDRSTFHRQLSDPRAIDPEPDGELRNVLVDNAAGHNQTEDVDTFIALIR